MDKRLENLKEPWPKGKSGNPAGKPPGARNRSTILKELLALQAKDAKIEGFQHPITREILMNHKQLELAEKGDTAAFKEIQDTVYGKMKEIQQIIPPDITPEDIESLTDEEAAAKYDAALKP